jgi:hypothetical protein
MRRGSWSYSEVSQAVVAALFRGRAPGADRHFAKTA